MRLSAGLFVALVPTAFDPKLQNSELTTKHDTVYIRRSRLLAAMDPDRSIKYRGFVDGGPFGTRDSCSKHWSVSRWFLDQGRTEAAINGNLVASSSVASAIGNGGSCRKHFLGVSFSGTITRYGTFFWEQFGVGA